MANPALIDELEKQFRDNPRRVFARLANEYRKGGDFMRAIEICHAHVPQQPGYISGHIVLGQALYDAGELDQAQQTFQAALALDPENLIALRQLGDISRSRRDFRDARVWYTKLLEVDPQNEEIVAQLGELALSENAHGTRRGDSSAAQDAELDEDGRSVAVAEDDEPVAAAPSVADDAPAEETHHGDAPQEGDDDPDPVTESLRGYASNGAGAGDSEPLMLDIEELEVEPSLSSPEPQTAAGRDAGDSSRDDEEIAWVAAEGSVEPDLVLAYEQLDETDDTETLIAEEPRDDDASREAEREDDFDLAFEPEEYEMPLRPHTGESLSVIAEEDALAGVHTGPWEDRSPFGDPIQAAGQNDTDDLSASFEPLPASEIDASAGDVPNMGDEIPDVHEAEATAVPEAHASSPGSDRGADPLGDFDLGDAETLVDDAASAFAWDDAPPAPAPAPETPSTWDHPARELDEPLMEWDAVAPGDAEPDSGGDDAAVTEANSEAGVEPQDASPAPDAADAAAEPDERSVEQAEGAASAFVTETMAQLYLQQGFRAEALEVYRKLAAQSPDDAALHERIAELAGPSPRAEVTAEAGPSAGEPTPAPHRTAASFLRKLASKPAPVAPPPATVASTNFGTWADEALSDAGEISDADQAAATALANAFAGEPGDAHPVARGGATRAAEHDMSLNDVFGARQRSEAGRASASMDAFFTPEGERAQDGTGTGDSPEDLEAFNAWLEGLKK